MFGQATWRQALDPLTGRGADELIHRVREAERSGPDGSRRPRGEIFDDAATRSPDHLSGPPKAIRSPAGDSGIWKRIQRHSAYTR
ncbi:hypothetical protein ABZV14_37220 [Streptosporangium canum]|uniref:hypothetical protein n=1 Tax=Streptosporangium canum TaxID=324952 RepID=UPI0033BC17EF